MRQLSLLSTVLAALALMLAATLGYQLIAPPREYEAPPVARRDLVPAVSLPEPPPPLPLAKFQEIEERPLFVPERRAFKEATVVEAPPEPRAPPNLTLIGIILDGKRKVAVAKVGAKSVTLTPGATIDGWSVVAIEADRIALRADDETHEIRLPKAVATAPALARPARPPRAPRMPLPPGYAPGQVPGRP